MKSDVLNLLAEARKAGMVLTPKGDAVHIEAMRQPPRQLLEKIRANKPAILSALRAKRRAPRPGAWDAAEAERLIALARAARDATARPGQLPHLDAIDAAWERRDLTALIAAVDDFLASAQTRPWADLTPEQLFAWDSVAAELEESGMAKEQAEAVALVRVLRDRDKRPAA